MQWFFLLLKIGMDGLPIDDLVDFEQCEAVNAVDGNDGLGGFLEKAAHGKFSKFGLGEFRGFFFGGGGGSIKVSGCLKNISKPI